MTPRFTQARHRLALLVLALHIGLGLALQQALWRGAPPPAAAAPVHVWISPPAAPAPATPPRAAAAAPARRLVDRPAPSLAAPARATEPQAITAPPPAASLSTAPMNPSPAAATTPAPLNLGLPARPASAPPAAAWARDDPRTQTAPLDGEQRMARTLGTDSTLRTVRRGDGFELRRGTGCLQVQPSRAGQILPADSSMARPAQVGNC